MQKKREEKSYGYNERHHFKSGAADSGGDRSHLHRGIFADPLKESVLTLFRARDHEGRSAQGHQIQSCIFHRSQFIHRRWVIRPDLRTWCCMVLVETFRDRFPVL